MLNNCRSNIIDIKWTLLLFSKDICENAGSRSVFLIELLMSILTLNLIFFSFFSFFLFFFFYRNVYLLILDVHNYFVFYTSYNCLQFLDNLKLMLKQNNARVRSYRILKQIPCDYIL